MSNETEIGTNALEDALVDQLAKEMRARGFALITVIGISEEDGEVATLGDVQITHSTEFAQLLRDLADQVEHTHDKHVVSRIMRLFAMRKQASAHIPERGNTERLLSRKFRH